jgi:hypothetical protein
MNKDVIYIEPEDDITDIISGIKASKEKIIALVPPKKSGILRSAVNFKLLAKTAKTSDKRIVVITTDDSLIRLAASAGVPVAKNLQSRPNIPVPEDEDSDPEENSTEDDTVEEPKDTDEVTEDNKDSESTGEFLKDTEEEIIESIDLDKDIEDNDTEETKKPKKGNKKDKDEDSVDIPNFNRLRKWIIISASAVLLIAGFLVWALIFAPAADIIVTIRTTPRNFSENISFVRDRGREDIEAGVFLLEEQKLTKPSQVTFEATGERDAGVRATGRLVVRRVFSQWGTFDIPANTTFKYNDLEYTITRAETITANGDSTCESGSWGPPGSPNGNCEVSATINVVALRAGENYNQPARNSGWTSSRLGLTRITSEAITGGTSRVVKVVTQEDINRARAQLTNASESAGRTELLDKFPEDLIPIRDSFNVTSTTPTVSHEVNEEVKPDQEVTISSNTVFTMYGVDVNDIEKFIDSQTAEQTQSESDQTIHSIGSPVIERFFIDAAGNITARVKTTYRIGPNITPEIILDRSLGRKIGEVRGILQSTRGVGHVEINTSFFWVTSIPSDVNKVHAEVRFEE